MSRRLATTAGRARRSARLAAAALRGSAAAAPRRLCEQSLCCRRLLGKASETTWRDDDSHELTSYGYQVLIAVAEAWKSARRRQRSAQSVGLSGRYGRNLEVYGAANDRKLGNWADHRCGAGRPGTIPAMRRS
jgi:hypothetical protein